MMCCGRRDQNSQMTYRLSNQCVADLKDIFRYTAEQFGSEQAAQYHASLEALFASLGRRPQMGRTRQDIDERTRSFVHQSHVVFYEIEDDMVLILRVLHGRQDPARHLD